MRSLREDQGISLRELAQRSSVSAPMLSQVERGTTSPTLAVAEKIADGLGLTLSQLLRLDEAPPFEILRAGQRTARAEDAHRWELLTPEHPGQRVAVSRHELDAGRRHRRRADAPRRLARVRAGRARPRDARAGRLGARARDRATASSSTPTSPHRFSGRLDTPAVILSVVTAGLRRS